VLDGHVDGAAGWQSGRYLSGQPHQQVSGRGPGADPVDRGDVS
jgi:hypothetical protein